MIGNVHKIFCSEWLFLSKIQTEFIYLFETPESLRFLLVYLRQFQKIMKDCILVINYWSVKNCQGQDSSLPSSIKIGWIFLKLFHANVPFSFLLTGSENQRFSNVLGGRDKKGNLNLNWINFGTYPAGIYLLKVNNRNTRTSVKYVHN